VQRPFGDLANKVGVMYSTFKFMSTAVMWYRSSSCWLKFEKSEVTKKAISQEITEDRFLASPILIYSHLGALMNRTKKF